MGRSWKLENTNIVPNDAGFWCTLANNPSKCYLCFEQYTLSFRWSEHFSSLLFTGYILTYSCYSLVTVFVVLRNMVEKSWSCFRSLEYWLARWAGPLMQSLELQALQPSVYYLNQLIQFPGEQLDLNEQTLPERVMIRSLQKNSKHA